MYKIYKVEMGETLESIANKLKTDMETLKTINGITGNVNLIPDSFLIVPVVDDRFETYTVKQGDTIYKISENYGVDPKLVLKINGLEKDTYIYPNQQIVIPNKAYKYYVTMENDTLESIAANMNQSVMDLVSRNENLYVVPDQLIIYR